MKNDYTKANTPTPLMNKLKIVFSQIKQGESFRDKLIIFIYWSSKLFKENPKLLLNVFMKHSGGIFFCDKNFEHLGYSSKDNEPQVQKNLIFKKGVFIDVGSHIGRHSIEVANRIEEGKVISIEPEKNNFDILKKNISLNNLDNVVSLNVACSDKKGTALLYTIVEGDGGSSLFKMEKHKGKVEVKIEILDNIVSDLKLKSVDYLKIDVESAEINVLKGAINTLKKFKPKIIFECYGDDKYKKINNFLTKLNYKIRRIDFLNYVAEIRKRGKK